MKSRGKGKNEFTNYYNRPILKKPHWVWHIWFYFWIGGIAGGASAITALVSLFGDKKSDRSIVQAGRYISLVGLVISPILLILDLQRPERFLHMLRILKLRSPLNLGTYILTSTALLGGINAARQVVEDGFIAEDSLPGKLALALSNNATTQLQGLGGLALGSYTGVLLSATAVPLWAETDTVLGPLFLSSSFSSGAAAISLLRNLNGVEEAELHRLERIEQAAILSELGLLTYATLTLKPQVRRHLTRGKYSPFFYGAILEGMVTPFLLQLFGPKQGKAVRPLNLLAALLVLGGSFQLRFAIIEAGKVSADDPDTYHAITQGRARPTPAEQAQNKV